MSEARLAGSLAAGLRELRKGRLVLLLTATTLALALPGALALWPALASVFGGTLAGDHVLRNHPSFAPLDVLEFLYEKRDALAGARRAAMGAALLGVLLQILYAGGFVETLGRNGKPSLGAFFNGAFRNFWYNIKCFGIFLSGAAILLGLWVGGTGAAARRLFEQTPPGATFSLLFRIATLLVALLLYVLFSLLHDFARMARRYRPSINAWRGYGLSRRILSASWLRAFVLFLFWLVAGGALWLLLVAVEWGTPAVSVLAIGLHVLLQLAAMAIRSAVRVGAWGSSVAFADARSHVLGPQSEAPGKTPELPIAEPLPPVDLIGEAPPP